MEKTGGEKRKYCKKKPAYCSSHTLRTIGLNSVLKETALVAKQSKTANEVQRVTDTIVLGDTKNLHACSIPSLPPPTLRGALLLLLLLLHKYVPCDGFEGRKVVRLSPLNINKPNPKRRRLGGIAVATLELSSRWPPKPKKRNEWAEDGSLVLAAAKREGGRRGGGDGR